MDGSSEDVESRLEVYEPLALGLVPDISSLASPELHNAQAAAAAQQRKLREDLQRRVDLAAGDELELQACLEVATRMGFVEEAIFARSMLEELWESRKSPEQVEVLQSLASAQQAGNLGAARRARRDAWRLGIPVEETARACGQSTTSGHCASRAQQARDVEELCRTSPEVAAATLVPGLPVRVVGLRSRAELNGAMGVLVELVQDKWRVRLDGLLVDKLFKAKNLIAVPANECEAEVLDVPCEDHVTGQAVAAEDTCGTHAIRHDASAGEGCIGVGASPFSEVGLDLEPGARVQLVGLKATSGSRGVLLQGQNGRWKVKLDDGRGFATLRSSYLQRVWESAPG